MRNRRRRIATTTALLAFAILTLVGRPTISQAATVSLTPPNQSTPTGTAFTVDLNISGLGSGTALSSFDISINFDSAAVSFSSVSFGDPVLRDQLDLGNLGLNGPTATAGTGTVDLIETDIFDSPSTLLSNQAHSFTLAALTLYGITAGTTPISVTINSLADQDGNPFVATTQNASVMIQTTTVPLPTASILLLSGLGMLGARVRSRHGRFLRA